MCYLHDLSYNVKIDIEITNDISASLNLKNNEVNSLLLINHLEQEYVVYGLDEIIKIRDAFNKIIKISENAKTTKLPTYTDGINFSKKDEV